MQFNLKGVKGAAGPPGPKGYKGQKVNYIMDQYVTLFIQYFCRVNVAHMLHKAIL